MKRREKEGGEKDIEKDERDRRGMRREGSSLPLFPAWQALART